tara:strand:+ start:37641 stop:39503 length:1863 start_codon:yes stop_codon:yes gene_type:complete
MAQLITLSTPQNRNKDSFYYKYNSYLYSNNKAKGKMEPEAKKKKSSKKKDADAIKSGSKYINTKPELDEAAKSDTVVVSWGRMNPVTSGHEKLALKVASEAKARKAVPAIYLSHSSDPKKNPLSYDDKIKFAQAAFGKIVVKSSAKTIIQVAAQLQRQYKNMVLVVGSDRVGEFKTLLNKYNGKDYTFDSIEVISAGERDPDADDVSGMSASKMRALAADNDLNTFKKGLPKRLQSKAQQVLDAVRNGMGIDEDINEEMTLDEVMDMAQRRKRAIVMKKHGKKIARARARSMKKKAGKEKLKGRAEKQVKKALKDKFAKGKNYADLSISQKQAIEKKIKKISGAKIKNMVKKKLPAVKAAEKERMSKKIDVEESSKYYTGVAQDKKDDREAHFKRKTKVNDDNPAAYTDAPGDKEAREKGTKPSKHTKRFKDMYGERKKPVSQMTPAEKKADAERRKEYKSYQKSKRNEVTEASKRDMMPKKRPHMLMAGKGGVKFDNRFKVYKAWKEKWLKQQAEFEKVLVATKTEEFDIMSEVLDLAESVEFIFESNPEKALKDKAAKSGMPYGILKKVFDRGVAAWRTGHRPGTTPTQWGLARVNSFATKSKGTWGKADKDLAAKVK